VDISFKKDDVTVVLLLSVFFRLLPPPSFLLSGQPLSITQREERIREKLGKADIPSMLVWGGWGWSQFQ
jgi:hypothetical protein